MSVKTINEGNFEEEVLKSQTTTIIDFYADWCGPCKMMSPIVEEVAEILSGKVNVVKINVDEETELAIKYNVSSIPTFVLIKDGKVVTNFVGMRDKEELMYNSRLYEESKKNEKSEYKSVLNYAYRTTDKSKWICKKNFIV